MLLFSLLVNGLGLQALAHVAPAALFGARRVQRPQLQHHSSSLLLFDFGELVLGGLGHALPVRGASGLLHALVLQEGRSLRVCLLLRQLSFLSHFHCCLDMLSLINPARAKQAVGGLIRHQPPANSLTDTKSFIGGTLGIVICSHSKLLFVRSERILMLVHLILIFLKRTNLN